MFKFAISRTQIDSPAEALLLKNSKAGALATFEGWIRNHNEGHAVSGLEYEVFEELAASEGQSILEEAAARFELHGAVCVHRSGSLEIGEMAVWVGATAAHRSAAFDASRYIIDEVKTRLPIWKRERYVDGRTQWVNCEACAGHSHARDHDHVSGGAREDAYYDRQIRLTDMGRNGQDKLRRASILIVGVGGLGAAAAQVLAGSGVGQIRLCDFDRLQPSNIHRQFLYSYADIGRAKSQLAADRLRAANPFIDIVAHDERFVAASADRLLKNCTIVLDCTDNLQSKFDLNDACVRLGVPLVSASMHRWDGELAAIIPTGIGGCLRCLWPDLNENAMIDTCSEAGVHGAMPALLGTMQALEATKLILGQQSATVHSMLLFDGSTLTTTMINRHRRPDCTTCGKAVPTPAPSQLWALSTADLQARSLKDFQMLDLRTEDERRQAPGPPASPLAEQGFEPSPEKTYLAFCSRGHRSRSFADQWQARGWSNVYAAICTPAELMRLLEQARE